MSTHAHISAKNAPATDLLTPARGNFLQAKCACGGTRNAPSECESCKAHERKLQRSPLPGDLSGLRVPPLVNRVLGSAGEPLDPVTREFFEPRFVNEPNSGRISQVHSTLQPSELTVGPAGDHYERQADMMAEQVTAMREPKGRRYDFSNIRIHSGAEAAESARAIMAQAYTVGRDIVFGAGQYAPQTNEGRRLLAHELTHAIQQQSAPQIQRKLSVDPNLPSNAPPNDPSASLTPATRFAMMGTLMQSLCPEFNVDSSGEVVSLSLQSLDRADLAASSKPTGCCCLSILTETPQPWIIEVSSKIGAHTNFGSHQVFLNPTNAPVEFGAFTASNTLAFQGSVPTAGHELCGHAALQEVQAHPPPQDRLTTDVHDPTVRIENQVSQEQGVPAAKLRGLAASGTNRGESVDKITISNFPFNVRTVPSSEQSKIQFAAAYIHTSGQNDEFVSILGHSDSGGSPAGKQTVSTQRAQNVKAALVAAGVPATITKFGLPTTARFTRVDGVSDSQPPPAPLNANQDNWRRVEILMSGFPAGASVPPAATPTTITPHTQNPNVPALKASSDPCISKLVTEAYP